MAENQSAVSDVMQKGMKAASTVKGAVNLGKSIAAAAKGGSSGGWIGALVALAWENRRLVAAIIAGVTVIFLLPVVVVSMLPGIIFGGTEDAFSLLDISKPILNSPTVITENMETVTSSVKNVFNEGLTTILQIIEEDKKSLPEGSNVLIEYSGDVNNNVNLIISQYCAAKNEDYKVISVTDLENTLKNNIDKLYRYEKVEKTLPVEVVVTVVDAKTGKEVQNTVIVEELFTVYTVFNNGDDYLADNIFKLTEEQKKLAKYYSENLTLFLQGGI